MVQFERGAKRNKYGEHRCGCEETSLQNVQAITKRGFEDKKKALCYGRNQQRYRE